MPRTFLCLLLFSLAGLSSYAQDVTKLKEADTLFAQGKFLEARNLYQDLYANDQSNTYLILQLAQTLEETNNSTRALELFDKAILIDKNGFKAHYLKARLLNNLGFLKESVADYSDAIRLHPIGEYYYWRGISFQRLKDSTSSMADYKMALSLGYETPQLYNNYAILQAEKQSFTDAVKSANKAIELKPNYAEAYSVRAKIRYCLLDFDSACADKNKAILLGCKAAFSIPDEICHGTRLAQLDYAAGNLAGSKNYKQAIEAYSLLLETVHDSSNYYLNRGFCYYSLNAYQQAETDYLKALTIQAANNDLIYNNLSILYFDQHNFVKTIEYTTKRIELNPKNHTAYLDRGAAYCQQKKYKEALADYAQVLAIKPDYYRAFGYRAYLNMNRGLIEKARADAQKSVDINPKYGYGYLILGQAKKDLGMGDFCFDLYSARLYGNKDAELAIKQFCK
jgi:tetratricopeptide (TPR) repeat protein